MKQEDKSAPGEFRALYLSFFKDAKVRKLPTEARLLFIGLICAADKWGVLENDPFNIWTEAYFSDKEVTEEQITGWINLLAEKEMLKLYEVDGHNWIYVTKWMRYQRFRYIPAPTNPLPEKLHLEGAWLQWREYQADKGNLRKYKKEVVQPKVEKLEAEAAEKQETKAKTETAIQYLINHFYETFGLPVTNYPKATRGAKVILAAYPDPDDALANTIKVSNWMAADPFWKDKSMDLINIADRMPSVLRGMGVGQEKKEEIKPIKPI